MSVCPKSDPVLNKVYIFWNVPFDARVCGYKQLEAATTNQPSAYTNSNTRQN